MCTEASTLSLMSSTILKNEASSLGGGLSATGSASFSIFGCQFIANNALLMSTIFGFNGGRAASYEILNTTAVATVGRFLLILGHVRTDNSIWNCSWPGSLFTKVIIFIYLLVEKVAIFTDLHSQFLSSGVLVFFFLNCNLRIQTHLQELQCRHLRWIDAVRGQCAVGGS